eukprot:c17331_g1_i1 orf=3-200(-)
MWSSICAQERGFGRQNKQCASVQRSKIICSKTCSYGMQSKPLTENCSSSLYESSLLWHPPLLHPVQ